MTRRSDGSATDGLWDDRCTGFGDCTCNTCASPEPDFPLATDVPPAEDWFNVSAGFWRSLWLVLRGRRIREWKLLPYEIANLDEVDL